MKKIIAIILVITMLACNSVNAASFVQDKKVELNNEHMKDYNNSSVKWKFDEKSGVLSFSGCEKLEKVDVGQIKNQVRYIVLADDINEISSGSLSGYFNLSKVTILGDVVATGNAFYLDTPRTLELAGRCENLGEMISSDMAPFPKIVLINNNKYYEEKRQNVVNKRWERISAILWWRIFEGACHCGKNRLLCLLSARKFELCETEWQAERNRRLCFLSHRN